MKRIEVAPGYEIPPIIVGLWQLSEGHRRAARSRAEAVDLLARLVDLGFTTFDCADIYTGVEQLLGDFRVGRRADLGSNAAEQLKIHTKFVPDRETLPNIDRAHVERIIDRSLDRLGVDRLDLVQFAWWDYDVPGYVEAASWLDELRRAGKIRAIGVTNFDVPRLREILEAGVPIATQQVQYSLVDRRPENGMAEFCAETGIHLLCYGTLAGGFISQRYRGCDPPTPPLETRSLTKYRLMIDEAGGWERFQALLETLGSISERTNVGIDHVALGWVLDRPSVSAALVGISHPDIMERLPAATRLGLTPEDLAPLQDWVDQGPVPKGDVFGLERERGSPHAEIMRYNLNRERDSGR